MYIQGVSPHPAPRTLSPADVEANLEDEVTARLKNELLYYITTSSPAPPLCLCL